jgi:drug/metabolite transporter (DMT)-like permease
MTTSRAKLLIAASGVFYGSLGYFGVSLRQAHFSLWTMLFWRFLIAAVILLLVLMIKKQSPKLSQETVFRFLPGFLQVSFLYCIAAASYFLSSEFIGTGFAMVFFFTYPVFVMLFGRLFENQHFGYPALGCLFFILLGTFFLASGHEQPMNLQGVFFGFSGAILYALYLSLSKKQIQSVSALVAAMGMCLGCALIALGISFFLGHPVFPQEAFSWNVVMAMAAIGLICTALPVLMMLEGLQYVLASTAALLSVLRPVTTVFIGVFAMQENIYFMQVLGVVLILVSTIVIQLKLD